jgi:hypothetical protein
LFLLVLILIPEKYIAPLSNSIEVQKNNFTPSGAKYKGVTIHDCEIIYLNIYIAKTFIFYRLSEKGVDERSATSLRGFCFSPKNRNLE